MAITTYAATVDGGVPLPEVVLAVYSREIEHKALPVLRFANFATPKTELGTMPGQKIIFTKYNNLSLGGQLSENVNIPTNALSATTHDIEVTEWGNAVAVTEALLRYSFDAVLTEAAYQLARDFAIVRDLMDRDALASTTNVLYAGGVGGIGSVADNLSTDDVLDATELLFTNNVPTFDGDYYVAFIHPHNATAIKKDPNWVNASLYAGVTQIFLGEIGRFDNVRFIATTHTLNGAVATTHPAYEAELDGTGAAGANLYRTLFCGDNAYGEAFGLPVEMRHNGVEDFGRKHGIAWYSIMGADIIENDNAVAVITA